MIIVIDMIRTRRWPSELLLACLSFVIAASACAPDAESLDDEGAPLDLLAFATDAPAVGDRWYEYDGATHVLTPKAERYVVREGADEAARFAAVAIVSYYDRDTAESGRFTVEHARFDGAAWTAPAEHVTSRNVKSDGPVCLDLFASASTIEVSCDDDGGWQVKLLTAPFLVLEGPLTVQSPAVRFRERGAPVVVATLAGEGLADLPDPSSLRELEDRPPSGWTTPEWDRSRLAPDLPRAGRLLGARFLDEELRGRGDVYFLAGTSRALARVTFAPEHEGDSSGGVIVRYAVAPLDFTDGSAGAFADADEQVVTLADGQVRLLRFDVDDGLAVVPNDPGRTAAGAWDLALSRDEDGLPSFALSSAAALLNHTAASGEDASAFDDAMPPLRTSNGSL